LKTVFFFSGIFHQLMIIAGFKRSVNRISKK